MELPSLLAARPGDSLGDAIYLTLRQAIIRGELPPGYRLREVQLSEHFEVSSTPVRSAIQRLGHEGLVEVSPRRGATVAPVTRQQLRQLYELRELLECHALRQLAGADDLDLSEIDEVLAASAQVLEDPDQTRFHELDLTLHARVTELAGNAELSAVAERTHRRILAVRMRHVPELPDQPPASHKEHIRIIESLRQGDIDSAEAQLREHIISVRDAVLDIVTDHAATSPRAR